jgi:hypothetical protein
MFLLLLLALQAAAPHADAPEAFAIFALSPGSAATLWSYDPARPDEGVVRRAEFPGGTSWTPDFLHADAQEFLRLQIPTPEFYVVHLYRADYGAWTVRKILETKQAHGYGAGATDVYADTDLGFRLIDRKSGAVRAPDPPYEVKALLDAAWIVRLADGRYARLDPASGKLLDGRFALPDRWFERGEKRMLLSPDRRRLAIVDLRFPDDPDRSKVTFGETIVLRTRVEVQDLDTGKLVATPIRVKGSGGSGRWFIPHGFDLRWSADGSQLACTSHEGKLIRLTLDPATLEVREKGPAEEPDRKEAPPPFPVSAVLLPAWKNLEEAVDQPDQRLAHALLKHSGLEYTPPRTWGENLIAFSANGGRFLLLMRPYGSPRLQDFHFGDLTTLQVRRVPCPPELKDAHVTIRAVPRR